MTGRMRVDLVTKENKGEYLIYSDGPRGTGLFLWQRGRLVEGGTYEGAYENIGDACFTVLHSRMFITDERARQYVTARFDGPGEPTFLFDNLVQRGETFNRDY